MTLPPSFVIATFLITEGVFVDPEDSGSWPLYVSFLPEEPDNAAAIFDTSGVKDGRLMSGPPVLHYGLEVMIRSTSYPDGWSKGEDLSHALYGIRYETVSIEGTDYLIESVSQTTTLLSLGIEDGTKRRRLFSLNLLATLKEVQQ